MVRSTIAQHLVSLLEQVKKNPDFKGITLLNGVSEAEFLQGLKVLSSGKAPLKAKANLFAVLFMEQVIADLEKQYSGALPARVAKELQTVLNAVHGGDHYLVVQSPLQLSAEMQKEIVASLNKKYGSKAYPLFKVNKALIGGLRVFYNGQVQDHSWLGRINVLTSIVS